VFGDQGKELLETAATTLEDLREHLKHARSLSSWETPLSGIVLGDSHLGAGETLNAILGMAMRLTASFCKQPFSEIVQAEVGVPRVAPMAEEETLPAQIRRFVERDAPKLVNHFNLQKEIVEGGRPPKFDYFGSRYVANFGMLKLNKINDGFQAAKVKLWDLDVLRADSALTGIEAYELLLLRPRLNGKEETRQEKLLKETVVELTEEAKKRDLTTVPVFDAEEASGRILAMEGLKR